MALLNTGGTSSVTTTNANVPMNTSASSAEFVLVNYSTKAGRVFFSPNNDLTLESSIRVGFTSEYEEDLARGVLVEPGEAVRALVRADTVDATATNNTVTISVENVHSSAVDVEIGVCLEGDINTNASV